MLFVRRLAMSLVTLLPLAVSSGCAQSESPREVWNERPQTVAWMQSSYEPAELAPVFARVDKVGERVMRGVDRARDQARESVSEFLTSMAKHVTRVASREYADSAPAMAVVRDLGGKIVGRALLRPVSDGVQVEFLGYDLPPGPHGFHVHEVGDCSARDFTSAGDHLAPNKAAHGLHASGGAHMGDMPNLEVAPEGTASLTFVLESATLAKSGKASLLAGDGTALVIHLGADDQKTSPSGQSGPRIACGEIKKT